MDSIIIIALVLLVVGTIMLVTGGRNMQNPDKPVSKVLAPVYFGFVFIIVGIVMLFGLVV